jgi:hypothetical protein
MNDEWVLALLAVVAVALALFGLYRFIAAAVARGRR